MINWIDCFQSFCEIQSIENDVYIIVVISTPKCQDNLDVYFENELKILDTVVVVVIMLLNGMHVVHTLQ